MPSPFARASRDLPRVIRRETMALAQKPTDKNWLHPSAGRSRQLALAERTRREAGPCRRGVHTQLASAEREARRTVSHARSSGFIAHGCLALKDSAAVWTQAFVSGLRAARQACVCASPCLLRCSSTSALFSVGRRAGIWFGVFTPAGAAALSEFPEMQRPDFMVIFPKPYRQRDPAHLLVEEEVEEP